MIDAIVVERFRGIEHGRLDGMRGLTVVTGPNSSGKSALLDALLIGVSPAPGDAMGRAVKRHAATRSAARWLVRGGQEGVMARVAVTIDGTVTRDVSISWERPYQESFASELAGNGHPHPYVDLVLWENAEEDGHALTEKGPLARTTCAADNAYRYVHFGNAPRGLFVRLLDPGVATPLETTYSEAVKAGRKTEIVALLGELLPGPRVDLEILTEDDGTPSLYLNAVPLALAGDGVQAFVQLALNVATAAGGVVLIEEPEVYQHPRTLVQTAKTLVRTVARGVQVVLTTHSLELIDALISQAKRDDELDELVMVNVALHDGQLRVSRHVNEEAQFMREQLEADFR